MDVFSRASNPATNQKIDYPAPMVSYTAVSEWIPWIVNFFIDEFLSLRRTGMWAPAFILRPHILTLIYLRVSKEYLIELAFPFTHFLGRNEKKSKTIQQPLARELFEG